MTIQGEKIIPILIQEEMRDSYIDYSMSVIVSRALPDVRDGLKPVHRRILYGMSDLGLQYNRPFKKCARIVGEVLGKYHPHGDTAVYDSLVRMVQDFSLRYPLVDGQGNFGSVDGDSAAAMRYTEARMKRITSEMLKDLNKNTVDFAPNFDDSLKEPTVLPAVIPNMLINGASGIAVGMATNIPPHNLPEVISALNALIDNPEIEIKELMEHIPAPDFPTGGIIYGIAGVKDAYTTGRGKIRVRARAYVETMKNGRENIIITEIPYQVNKSRLLEKIVDLIKHKKVVGITDIRDESDRDGMRVVIELRKDIIADVILNQLYSHTSLQTTFGVILLALVNGQPRVLNLKQILVYYIEHRHIIILRRTKFDLEEARKKEHILSGLKIALDNLDAIISLIRKSRNFDEAQQGLMKNFKLSEIQSKAILEMRLHRLTGLERKKIEDEYRMIIMEIERLTSILDNKTLQMEIIKKELSEINDIYNDERRTEIIADSADFSIEDLIAEEDMVITISHHGFIKRVPVSGYRRQGRGGRGATGATTKEEDYVEHLFIASTHQYILFFTDNGRCYWLKVHEIPQGGKVAKGRAIVNLIDKQKHENIAAFVPVKEFREDQFIAMSTKRGLVKKTPLSAYSKPRRNGINAIIIREDDALLQAKLTDGTCDIVLGINSGKAIRFHEKDVRPMGRMSSGVKGITLAKDDYVVGMVIIRRETTLLVVTENGYGKRSDINDYRVTHRGGKGIITIKTTDKVGNMVTIKEVVHDDDLMIITVNGVVIRMHVSDIRTISRNTQGVRLIKLDHGDRISDVSTVVKNDYANGENGNGESSTGENASRENGSEEISDNNDTGSEE